MNFARTIRILTLVLFSIISNQLFAGYIQGIISNEQGDPLPFANIYIKNTSYGIASNLNGEYFLEMKAGTYIIVFSYIGYEPLEKTVTVEQNKGITLNVSLKSSSMMTHEIEIVANKRDRAKLIMDQVRDKRKYYLDQVENYHCETYLKTSLEKETVHEKIIYDSLKDEKGRPLSDEKSITEYYKKEKLNLIETISETYFENPEKYLEVIKAYHFYSEQKENFGQSVSVGVEYGQRDIAPVQQFDENPYLLYQSVSDCDFNFYKNLIYFPGLCNQPLLSPLAYNSGLSYTFLYIGSFVENEKMIYKIEVSPVFKTDALFRGVLFIEDSTWNIRSVDLTINEGALMLANTFRIIQNYEQINDSCYLPVRREIIYSIKDGKETILGNTRVNHSNYIVNTILPKKTFTTEIKKYEVDAFDKDSNYWSKLRPITLKESELAYIKTTDSIQNYFNSDEYLRKQDSMFNRITWWAPLAGIGHSNYVKGYKWYIYGIPNQINPYGIGGYRHKLPGYFNKEFKKNGFLIETDGFIDYGFRNKDIKGEIGVGLTYVPLKFVRTYIRFGDFYEQINEYSSIEQAFSRSNYIRTKSFRISQRMEIINGLFGELTFDYSDQNPINNLIMDNWSKYLFGDLNEPSDFKRYTKCEIRLEMKYRIGQKYFIRNNRKIIIGTDYPELSLIYRKGIPGLLKSTVNFDYLELGAKDEMKFARLGSSRWEINTGIFLNKIDLRLLEYKFFRGSDRYIFSNPLLSFQLLGLTMNTSNSYFRANYIHHFEGAIMNKIPYINRLKLSITAGAGTLMIPDADFAHIEMFAGLERIIRIKQQLFRVGIYAVTADNSLENANFTWKIGLDFFNTYTNKWTY